MKKKIIGYSGKGTCSKYYLTEGELLLFCKSFIKIYLEDKENGIKNFDPIRVRAEEDVPEKVKLTLSTSSFKGSKSFRVNFNSLWAPKAIPEKLYLFEPVRTSLLQFWKEPEGIKRVYFDIEPIVEGEKV